MPLLPFAIALAFRSLSLLLPHTYFQPDEFYQAFEPAYATVFGRGYLTWEWRDLPPLSNDHGWWGECIERGRLRGWIWPGVFVVLYYVLSLLGLSGDIIAFAPRVVGVLVAATTDYYTFALAAKLFGRPSGYTALFLSLTSLFHGHLLPRALSTSPETLLTVAAVYYYPLASSGESLESSDGEKRHVGDGQAESASQTASEKANEKACEKKLSEKVIEETNEKAKNKTTSAKIPNGAPPLSNGTLAGRNRNYSKMDRCVNLPTSSGSVIVAAALASLSICIRPTMLVFWGYLHLEQSVAQWRVHGLGGVFSLLCKTLFGGIAVFLISTGIDYAIVGRLTVPVLSFVHRNVVLNIASFYGSTGLLYHLVQSLPLLLFPIWYWWGQGFIASLLPRSMLPPRLACLDTPDPLRSLARTVVFTIAALSLSPHSEWRFVHPLLPLLLLFAIPALQRCYTPPALGADDPRQAFRQFFRLPKPIFYLILLAPVLPYLYLNVFHGAAQVSVISALRAHRFGEVDSLVVLMPCHSTPWASHLGNVPGWFITCEPPLTPGSVSQQDVFYSAPVSYLADSFPDPPLSVKGDNAEPSHVLLFGCLLDEVEPIGPDGELRSVRQVLANRGYYEAANLWNGFDVAQDEEKRRGGVRVWVKSDRS